MRGSAVAAFEGKFEGCTFDADWERASADRVVWSAVIRRDGKWVASPTGRLHNASPNDDVVEEHVRLAVEVEIDRRFIGR